jgi:N12 class adenine-specific DNA methylase
MKRKTHNINQLSLFDHENNEKDERAERESVPGQPGPQNRNEEPPRKPQGEDGILRVKAVGTGTLFSPDGNENHSVDSEQGGLTVLRRSGQAPGGRNAFGGSGRTGVAETAQPDRGDPKIENYHRTKPIHTAKTFNKQKALKGNLQALQLLLTLETEHRQASLEEKEILARYVGFGGLKEILLDPDNDGEWKTESEIELRPLIKEITRVFRDLDASADDLLAMARRSVLSAHFTPFPVINAIYKAIESAGFQGGNVLEPSAGVGNFLAAMPKEISSASTITAVEMEVCTGKMLSYLFPSAETRITPFERLPIPENSFDLIVSNIPFGSVPIYDPQLFNHKDKAFHKAASNIHNYYFAKALLLAKPGALIAFITSRYTLDSSENSAVRDLINSKAKFIGAIRLPDETFRCNAGTTVVADIIFLQKFEIGQEQTQSVDFCNIKSAPYTDPSGVSGIISYNEYFHDHPSHLLGTPTFGGLYRKDEFNLSGGTDLLYEQIVGICENLFPKPILKQQRTIEVIPRSLKGAIKPGLFESVGNIVALEDGTFGAITSDYYVDEDLDQKALSLGINPHSIRSGRISTSQETVLSENGVDPQDFLLKVIDPIRINKADRPKIKNLIEIRGHLKQLLFHELNDHNDKAAEESRSALKKAYSLFVKKHGNLLHKSNEKLLRVDSDGFLIQSLEVKDKITGKISPSDILNFRTIRPQRDVTEVKELSDAVLLSLQRYGKLQMSYICELLNTSYTDLMVSQRTEDALIFIDEGYEHLTRDEYLTGNVVEKLELARSMASKNPDFAVNVLCLEKVQPKPIPLIDIYSPVHARWIPKEDLKAFIAHILKTDGFSLMYSKSLDDYTLKVNSPSAMLNNYKSARKSAEWVIEHALKGVEPVVKYLTEDSEGNEITVVDIQDTHFAKELYKKVKNEWDDFKISDPDRRRNLEELYNKTYNTTVLRTYDGSHLTFPGLVGVELRPHQKDAVFRNVQQVGGLNDHIVGSGKTLVQICTAMELRRLAICHKPMIIGMKSQIPQLYETFRKVYPFSKILFPTEKDFTKENRLKLLNTIATNDWDCIIITHDQFTSIRQPLEIQEAMINEHKKEIEAEFAYTDDKFEKKKLQSRLYKYEQKLDRLNDLKKDTQVLDFAQLGVDFLMVDESQEFKNLEFLTRKTNVRGLGNPTGSKRAFNMEIACRYLQSLHGADKGILFASGTPISNTIAELYLIFKYLRPTKMKAIGLTTFDSWAANFANDYSDLEYYMGRFKEVHRFREFANLPELITLYREIADVRNNQNIVLEKPKAVHILKKIQPSEYQLERIEMLQQFIETKGNSYADELGLTAGYDYRKKVNPSYGLLAVNYARKLSLDPRLIDPSAPPGSKLAAAADDFATTFHETTHLKATQLVFSDLGTPKSLNTTDNLYNYLEGDISDSDLKEIFTEDYWEAQRKPPLSAIKEKLSSVLNLKGGDIDTLIETANTTEQFNVYSEMKRLLVERGVPADQVVFIHDYNTRAAKTRLYDLVNAGDIRIVIGSTKKLGTGTNVQTLCVGGGHLDIPWKPSELTQRNGRFDRQGNEIARKFFDNIVRATYYATERTLDASMYNTVSLKAHFIDQMKIVDDPSIRVIKDIEEDVDMGHMAAELSGDPIFKEKANLTKKITELEQLNRSFLQKRINTEDALRKQEVLKLSYQDSISNLEQTIQFLDKIPRKNNEPQFLGYVNNIEYDKVSSFGAAMIYYAKQKFEKMPEDNPFIIGELWGFKVQACRRSHFILGSDYISREVLNPVGKSISSAEVLPDTEMAAGLQIRSIILDLPNQLATVRQKLSTTNENISEYLIQLKSENPYKLELERSKSRLAEVDQLIINRTEKDNGNTPESTITQEAHQSKMSP